jgi:hypothetical protein
MPDSYGFNCLPWHGYVVHRCVECEWPGWGKAVSEADRRRHHDTHMRDRRRAAEQASKANLAKARKAKTALARENSRAYRPEGHE